MSEIHYKYNLLELLAKYGPIDGPKKLIELSEKLGIEFYELQKYIHGRRGDEGFLFSPDQLITIMNVLKCSEWDITMTKF